MTIEAPRRFRAERNVRLLYALGLLTQFQPGLAVWVVYLTDFRHLTLAQVGVMEAVFWGVKVLIEVPSGAVADRFGRRASFWLGLVIEGSGVVLFAFASNYPLLLLSYVLWSGGFSFRSGNDQAYIYDSLAADGRAHEFTARAGVYRAMTSTAFLVSGIGGAWLASRTTLQVPLMFGAVPYVGAMFLLAKMQEPPRTLAAGPRAGYAATLRTAFEALRRDAALRYALLFEITLSAAWIADILLVQPFMKQHGVALALFGLLQAPARLANVLGSLAGARAVRLAGIRGVGAAALVSTVGALLLLALVDHVVAFAGFIAIQLALGVVTPALGGYVNDRTDSAIRATVLSVVPLGTAVVYAFTGPFAGIVGDASLRLAFGGMALAVLASAGTCYALWVRAETYGGD